MTNEDFVLDVLISVEETEGMMIKRGKSCGPDDILHGHIIYGGALLKVWLGKIFSTIVELESIPACLNNSIIRGGIKIHFQPTTTAVV